MHFTGFYYKTHAKPLLKKGLFVVLLGKVMAIHTGLVIDLKETRNETFLPKYQVSSITLRSTSGLAKLKVLVREFAGDVYALWRYGAPFPTFLKLIGTLLLCLLVVMPLIYPVFVVLVTYFTFEGLYLSWWLDQPWRFYPSTILRRALSKVFRPYHVEDVWKVREVLTRGVLLAHSLATSVDYLCVMQGLLDET